jgi:hypothetical protein
MPIKQERLEYIVVNVSLDNSPNPPLNTEETQRLVIEVADELKDARIKCSSMTHLVGRPVSILKLSLNGKTSVESIGMTYVLDGRIHNAVYCKEDFYNLS